MSKEYLSLHRSDVGRYVPFPASFSDRHRAVSSVYLVFQFLSIPAVNCCPVDSCSIPVPTFHVLLSHCGQVGREPNVRSLVSFSSDVRRFLVISSPVGVQLLWGKSRSCLCSITFPVFPAAWSGKAGDPLTFPSREHGNNWFVLFPSTYPS